jgi:hypothetical protein
MEKNLRDQNKDSINPFSIANASARGIPLDAEDKRNSLRDGILRD